MLYVLHGSDTKKGRDKLHTLLAALQKKRPEAALLHYDEETFATSALDELIHGQGLFSQKSIIVIDQIFQNADLKKTVLDQIKNVAASENVFVLFEGALDKKTLTKLEKHAEKMQSFEVAKAEKKKFDIFSLTDAFARRDRKGLWVKYQEAKMHGAVDEEIHGILFWQVKSLLLAERAGSAKEAGLNPFVFKKALAALRNYSRDELTSLSEELVTLYHDARRGRHELATALERFILRV